MIVEDTAGMGKSTITKKLFQSIIEESAGIPILIELRQLNVNNTILNEIQTQLSPIGKQADQDFILKIINEGDFIFLFDGFDEIANIHKDFVISELKSFIEKASNNYFLITSRADDSLTSFGQFRKFRIKSLKKSEAYSLINRYDLYSFKPIGLDLIDQLEKNESKALTEYLTNPLLVSLLYKSFEFKKDIPVKKSQFYRQVYDSLFETHDLSKEGYFKREKYSKLHIDDFERVLRHVGYFTAVENVIEYDKNFILKVIDKSRKHLTDLDFMSSDYLKDLISTVPIFKQEGNYFRWSHKSLQDYFAAKFLWIDAKSNREKILKKIFSLPENRRFYNLLDIYYELDPITFDSTITFWVLNEFCTYANENIKKFKNVAVEDRKTRIENTFATRDILNVSKTEDYEDIRFENGKKSHEKIAYYHSKVPNQIGGGVTNLYYFSEQEIVVFNHHFNKRNIQTILSLLRERKPHLISIKHSGHEQAGLIGLKECLVLK